MVWDVEDISSIKAFNTLKSRLYCDKVI